MARIHVGDHARRFRILPALERLVYPHAPAIAGTSHDVARDLLDHLDGRVPPERVLVLPNPIDVDEIRRLAAPLPKRKKCLRFCAIGRLTYQKGYDILLDALARARTNIGSDWELDILGEGPLFNSLEDRARRLQIAENVHFHGFVDNPYPSLAGSDIFLHAARWEGFGLVIAEALSLSVPVVATSCSGGPKEILDRGHYGILVPPDDPAALAEAIVRTAEDEELRSHFARSGPDRALEYSPERIARQVIGLAERLGAF